MPLMPGGRRGGTVAGPQRKGRPTASRDGKGTEGAVGREVPGTMVAPTGKEMPLRGPEGVQ